MKGNNDTLGIMKKVFLSHKDEHATAAEALADVLSLLVRRDEIFLSKEIDKGGDWRREIDQALEHAKCFILLYKDPKLDWAWCFYEAGRFTGTGGPENRDTHPIYCVHSAYDEPPSQLAHLQTIKALGTDLEQWVRTSLCSVLQCRKPRAGLLAARVKVIEDIVTDPLSETVFSPFIWIEPPWPFGEPDWNGSHIPHIDYSGAIVSLDKHAAMSLGFASPPPEGGHFSSFSA
jgi:TIR domain